MPDILNQVRGVRPRLYYIVSILKAKEKLKSKLKHRNIIVIIYTRPTYKSGGTTCLLPFLPRTCRRERDAADMEHR